MAITTAHEQVVKELHSPARLKFQRRRCIQYGLDDTFASNLVQLDQYVRENKGFKYILIVINCFSKFLWTRARKSKTAQEVAKAMEDIFKKFKRIPEKMVTDNGKEHYNSQFQNLMKKTWNTWKSKKNYLYYLLLTETTDGSTC